MAYTHLVDIKALNTVYENLNERITSINKDFTYKGKVDATPTDVDKGDVYLVEDGKYKVYTGSGWEDIDIKYDEATADKFGLISLTDSFKATSSAYGLVKVDSKGAASGIEAPVFLKEGTTYTDIPKASSSTYGVIKPAASTNGLDINANGEIKCNIATTDSLGTVKIGNGIDIKGGVISVDTSTLDINPATTTKKGAVIVGSGLQINTVGVLSVDNNSLPKASTGGYGVIKVTEGNGLTISDGKLSLNDVSKDSYTAKEFEVKNSTTGQTDKAVISYSGSTDDTKKVTINKNTSITGKLESSSAAISGALTTNGSFTVEGYINANNNSITLNKPTTINENLKVPSISTNNTTDNNLYHKIGETNYVILDESNVASNLGTVTLIAKPFDSDTPDTFILYGKKQ